MEDLIAIGRFSEATRLSQKALRLYDERGLLRPAHVDPDNGYRSYAPTQVREARLIALLRGAGMSLGSIARFLADPDAALLDEHEAQLVDELAERRRVLEYARRVLKEERMYEVQTRRNEPRRYVGRTARVTVDKLAPFIIDTVNELEAAHTSEGPSFAIYHGTVTEDDDGPVEVGVPAADGDRELPAQEVAFTLARGEQTRYPQIIGAYDAIWDWAKTHGRELDGPPRETYLAPPGPDFQIEVSWPLK